MIARHQSETGKYPQGFGEGDRDAIGREVLSHGVICEGTAGAGEACVPAAGPKVIDRDCMVERTEQAWGGRVTEDAMEGFEDDIYRKERLDSDDGRMVLGEGDLEEDEEKDVEDVILELCETEIGGLPCPAELSVHRLSSLLLDFLAFLGIELPWIYLVLSLHRGIHQGHVRRRHKAGRERLISELEDVAQSNKRIARHRPMPILGEDVATADEQVYRFECKGSDFWAKEVKSQESKGKASKREDIQLVSQSQISLTRKTGHATET